MTPDRPPWRVVAASVPGTRHERLGQACQDSHAWQALPGGGLAVAVADGAGCAPLADVGAALAARAAVAQVAASWGGPPSGPAKNWRPLLKAPLRAARQALAAEARRRGCPAGHLATTLIVVIATPAVLAAGQVGDGAVVALLAGGEAAAVTRPAYDEFLNQTTFLTGGTVAVQWAVRPGPVSGLASLSDGLQMLALKMPEGVPHAPFFAPLLRFARAVEDEAEAERRLRGFLRAAPVTRRTDDDLTLVLAVLPDAGRGR